jgi:hypothetical protein
MRYRLYCLSQENRIIDTAEVDCDTDEQAIATAQDFAGRGKAMPRNKRVVRSLEGAIHAMP